MAALYDAQGDRDKAQTMNASLQAHCGAAPASKDK
jgi:hypothetical protein